MSENNAAGTKRLSDKQRILMLLVCPVIVIVLCSVAIVYTVKGLEPEMSEVTEASEPDLGVFPEDREAAAEFCDMKIEELSTSHDVMITSDTHVSFGSLNGELSANSLSVLEYISGSIAENAGGRYESERLEYGDPADSIVPVTGLAEHIDGIEGAFDESANTYGITLNAAVSGYDLVQSLHKKDGDIYGECKRECAEFADIVNDSFELSEFSVEIIYDVQTKRISSIRLIRLYSVEMHVDFLGAIDGIGSGNIGFECRVATEYAVTYAGISIAEDNVELKKNGYTVLTVGANVSEDATEDDFGIEFISSDESVVKVDENGMVEAVGESDAPVTVTVRLTYLGNVYEDSCKISVRKDK